jgi:pSer/pThr/pTyr-binding forkhead associated (FHA) protein
MELKLVVLAGAKEGLEIPLKKEKFLIGRAKECALRAGSEAISRRHCAIVRENGSWTVRDLGSRNGTYVNEERIADIVPIKAGDEVRVGPLKFRVAASAAGSSAKATAAPASTAKPAKQPKVKNVADVVQRTISNAEAVATEDDVSRWLLGIPEADSEAVLKETRSMRREDTAVKRTVAIDQPSTAEAKEASEEAGSVTDEVPDEEAEQSSGWSFFKRGKGTDPKKKPGKLPPRPDAPSKDSREAAADILREMTRRR